MSCMQAVGLIGAKKADLKICKRMTAMSNEELIAQYYDGDRLALHALLEQNTGFIKSTVKEFGIINYANVSFENTNINVLSKNNPLNDVYDNR